MSDQTIWKTGVTLAVIAAICTALVAATYRATAQRIADNEKALLEQSLAPALSGLFYDSGVSESRLVLEPPQFLTQFLGAAHRDWHFAHAAASSCRSCKRLTSPPSV